SSVRFLFSSWRRHTRFSRDWSSDVCSSDLPYTGQRGPRIVAGAATADSSAALDALDLLVETRAGTALPGHGLPWFEGLGPAVTRSDERRVGKEGSARGLACEGHITPAPRAP